MLLGGRLDQIVKQFIYEKGRTKNQHSSENKKNILGTLAETLDEMEEYIDQKTKESEIFKRR